MTFASCINISFRAIALNCKTPFEFNRSGPQWEKHRQAVPSCFKHTCINTHYLYHNWYFKRYFYWITLLTGRKWKIIPIRIRNKLISIVCSTVSGERRARLSVCASIWIWHKNRPVKSSKAPLWNIFKAWKQPVYSTSSFHSAKKNLLMLHKGWGGGDMRYFLQLFQSIINAALMWSDIIL